MVKLAGKLLIYWISTTFIFNLAFAFEKNPIRYWKEHTPIDATTWRNASIPIKAMFQHRSFTTAAASDALSRKTGRACYHNEQSFQDVDTSVEGKYFKILFSNPNITRFAVTQPYNSDTHSARIIFDTTWHKMEGANYSDIVQTFEENGLFNITFFTIADLEDPNLKCPVTEYFYVSQRWCNSTSTYQGSIIQPSIESDSEGRCRIKFVDQVKHYISMWRNNVNSNDFKKRCLEDFSPVEDITWDQYQVNTELYDEYPRYYKCHRKFGSNIKNCTDPKYNQNFFLTNAKGNVIKIVLGKNNDTIDFNMTIDFTYWTSEFIDTFSNTFKLCGYELPLTNMSVEFFTKDEIIVPERGTPISFWIFVIVTAVPAFVLFVSILLLVCTCTRKGFRTELWDFFKWQRSQKKHEKEKAEEAGMEKVLASLDNGAFEKS
ncbi:uncharacterized protein LOC130628518 [Hydractinia symbiolongicarpus]|uniref:uncharacterized protein LOC130628518 n=1 Tax=Hydractinia symbiolongicarpus TaxID=13093 RepID=UPI002550712B|nr:uncharacterized protein LOC130628518 [Hydractinia symbiolongicarpus]